MEKIEEKSEKKREEGAWVWPVGGYPSFSPSIHSPLMPANLLFFVEKLSKYVKMGIKLNIEKSPTIY